MGSPEQRRTPAAPLAPSAAAVPPPSNQSRGPVTFGRQTYHNLPPHLAALVAATASLSAAPQPSTSSAIAMLPPLNPNSSERAVTFGGQTYQNLPPDLVAWLATVAPFPAAPQHYGGCGYLSLPSLVPPWVQWSNELAREMYIKCALQRLELQYPHDSIDS